MAQTDYIVESTPPTVLAAGSFISQAVDFDGRTNRVFMLLAVGEILQSGSGSIRVYAQESDDPSSGASTWVNVASHPIIDENVTPGRVTQVSFVRTKRYVRSRGVTVVAGALHYGLADYIGSIE